MGMYVRSKGKIGEGIRDEKRVRESMREIKGK